jgi:hypothetical protein
MPRRRLHIRLAVWRHGRHDRRARVLPEAKGALRRGHERSGEHNLKKNALWKPRQGTVARWKKKL